MDLTRLSVKGRNLSNYHYSFCPARPVDGRMVLFLAKVLLQRISERGMGDCSTDFRGKLVCAYNNACYLDMEYCSMLAFNCARHAQLILFIVEGTCGLDRLPKNNGFLISGREFPYLLIDD